ncbi:Peptidyl-prolyl cis-trans isomerase CYP59 [Camellia lanceoleosa]|uniref:Peptidyl-prolyl cis-trans isomerase CYP59 n=1 Tax=Camellia lanceoleosa TaxID=1840588 RepID=A0ACC0HJM8_9ERIC|nr:Peptidyl-prolyl cis-trans isomerase CYP59 [Camellia lanceoleosa]
MSQAQRDRDKHDLSTTECSDGSNWMQELAQHDQVINIMNQQLKELADQEISCMRKESKGVRTIPGSATGKDMLYVLPKSDPFDNPSQLSELIPDASPEGKPKDEVENDVRLEDDWVSMDEQLGASELEEILRTKDAHSSAVVLESVRDIPDADIKPPDNVLFVCKLNPVTEVRACYLLICH